MSKTAPTSSIIHTLYAAPFGELVLVSDGEKLVGLLLPNSARVNIGVAGSSTVLKEAAGQLDEYFTGKRREFDIPLAFTGTQFQVSVWEALRRIGYGETATYAEIAAAIGNPKAVRAVGGANNRNPIPIIIPCHRVIGADGSLVGYGGGLDVKEFLLGLESGASQGA